jgi:hypothetical protein
LLSHVAFFAPDFPSLQPLPKAVWKLGASKLLPRRWVSRCRIVPAGCHPRGGVLASRHCTSAGASAVFPAATQPGQARFLGRGLQQRRWRKGERGGKGPLQISSILGFPFCFEALRASLLPMVLRATAGQPEPWLSAQWGDVTLPGHIH